MCVSFILHVCVTFFYLYIFMFVFNARASWCLSHYNCFWIFHHAYYLHLFLSFFFPPCSHFHFFSKFLSSLFEFVIVSCVWMFFCYVFVLQFFLMQVPLCLQFPTSSCIFKQRNVIFFLFYFFSLMCLFLIFYYFYNVYCS